MTDIMMRQRMSFYRRDGYGTWDIGMRIWIWIGITIDRLGTDGATGKTPGAKQTKDRLVFTYFVILI